MEEIILKLKELSKERGSLSYIAKRTGIKIATIRSWVYTNKKPGYGKLQAIKEYFNKMDNNKYFF